MAHPQAADGGMASNMEGNCEQWRTQEFFSGGGVQQIQLRTEDRERESEGGSPLVRSSGGSCNLVQEISFHIANVS
jgi:hypothetical protein